ncbi:MAG: bifunctional nicotinamidase/pyrazinamidase [Candidatus Hodarchaeales archaeon]
MVEINWQKKTAISSDDVLIVIDIQNDFLAEGSLEVPNGNSIITPINNIGQKFKNKGAKIVFTQDWHPKNHLSFASQHIQKSAFDPISKNQGIGPILWPDHCVQGSEGAAFHSTLDMTIPHLIIRKGYRRSIDSYSGFLENDKTTETGLNGYLSSLNIKKVFICGLALDYCVNFSASDAKMKGFDVYVIYDLTKGIAEESISKAVENLQKIDVKFINSSELVF